MIEHNADSTETPAAAPTPDRDAILAELRALREEPSEAAADDEDDAPAPAARPAPAAAPAADDDEDDDDESEDEDAAADDDEDDDEDDDDAVSDAKPDPAAAKGLAAVQKAEKRAREAEKRARDEVAAERRKVEEERTAWRAEKAKHDEQLAKFSRLAERVNIDPAAVLAELGLEDFDWAARQVFARSPAAQKDPKNRDAAAHAQRDREKDERIAKLEKRLEEVDERDKRRQEEAAKREEEAQIARAVEEYIDGIAKSVTDETPLVQKMLAANPQRTRVRMQEVAEQLMAKRPDKAPSPRKVARVLERQRRAELEELGVDVAAVAKAPLAAKKNGKAAAPKNGATAAASDDKPLPVSRARAAEDERKSLLNELRTLKNS